MQNSSKLTHDGNKQFRTYTREEEADRRRRQKRKTRESLVKLKFF